MSTRRQNENVFGIRRDAVGGRPLKKVIGADENSIAKAKAPRAASKTLAVGNKTSLAKPTANAGESQDGKLDKLSTIKATTIRRPALSSVSGTPLRPTLASKQASTNQPIKSVTKPPPKTATKPTPRLKSSIPVATRSTEARVPTSTKIKKTLSIYTPGQDASKAQNKSSRDSPEYMPPPARERDYRPLGIDVNNNKEDIFANPSEPEFDFDLDIGMNEPPLMRPELGPDLDLDLDLDLSLKLDDEPLRL
ncbi:hypothetical protein IAR50_000212 [Cryptococcus sp. DSM 104548]